MGAVLGYLCQGAYGFLLFMTMGSAALAMKVLYLLPFSKDTREGLSLMLTKAAWQTAFLMAPWMWTTQSPETSGDWKSIIDKMDAIDAAAKASGEQRKPLFVIANHTSFLDTVIFAAKAPSKVLWRCRTYMSNYLYKLPILGTVCRSIGHFPVHFQSTEEGTFKVDNEKMQVVDQQVNEHINSGGWLCFFPEGQVNKDPDTLLPFRFGGMKKALEFDARLIAFVCYGNTKAWPKKAAVGGLPCSIRYGARLLAPDGCKALLAKLREQEDVPQEDKDLPDHALLAKHLQVMMQSQYDEYKMAIEGGRALKSD